MAVAFQVLCGMQRVRGNVHRASCRMEPGLFTNSCGCCWLKCVCVLGPLSAVGVVGGQSATAFHDSDARWCGARLRWCRFWRASCRACSCAGRMQVAAAHRRSWCGGHCYVVLCVAVAPPARACVLASCCGALLDKEF